MQGKKEKRRGGWSENILRKDKKGGGMLGMFEMTGSAMGGEEVQR
jgi:hypothetical protein